MANVLVANPYLKNRESRKSNSIVYGVVRTSDGWKIEAALPVRVSPSDRLTVLEWFKDYRRIILEQHPNWTAMFHPGSSKYVLEVRSMNSDKEIVAAGENLRSVCGEMMDYV